MIDKKSEQEVLKQLTDLTYFAPEFFVIIDKLKTGKSSTKKFKFNRVQKYLHARLEAQKERIGRVRAVILKGRQQGCSTYVQGRFFHGTITHKGIKTYILTHEGDATENIFNITKRYHDNLPEGLCPTPDKAGANALSFSALDSGYSVGTAGNRGAGRSQTVTLFHGSEVAFWPHGDEHGLGVIQSVADVNGTEIILESTANGMGNYFHQMYKSAEAGETDFEAIFLPWYWQEEYTSSAEGMNLTDEEQIFMQAYESDGLTKEHLAWRRKKINLFSRDYEEGRNRFDQEYPICADVAFRNNAGETFIKAQYVIQARKNKIDSDSALLIGVDPAVSDRDKCAIIRRRGRKAFQLETHTNTNTMQIAGIIKQLIDKEHPAFVYIDVIGIGAGIVDRLYELGYSHIVRGVCVSKRAYHPERYVNLRAELWDALKQWLMQDSPVQIPDEDELHGDICSFAQLPPDSGGKLVMETKAQLKKRGLPSPDRAEALMLTFAHGMYEVNEHYQPEPLPFRKDMFS